MGSYIINDNLVHQIGKNQRLKFKEVENLYLLIGLAILGRQYWLPEKILGEFLGIQKSDSGDFSSKVVLNHFSITVALFYMRSKSRYNDLRKFVIDHALKKVVLRKMYCSDDAETLILYLDLISCPYVDNSTKDSLSEVYSLVRADWQKLCALSPNWFTAWHSLKLGEALDAKRSREVY